MADVTCGAYCCAYNVTPGGRSWQHRVPDDEGEPEYIDYCPHTGERLTVVDGQPVAEPLPSDEYVRVLEVAICSCVALMSKWDLFGAADWEHLASALTGYRDWGVNSDCRNVLDKAKALAAEREEAAR